MTQVVDTGSAVTPAAPGAPALRKVKPSQKWSRRAPLLPALIFAIVVTQIPFLVTLYLSTLGWNALRPGERRFVGVSNYGTVLTDSRLRAALVNTVILTASSVILSVLIGLGLAILLDRRFPGRAAVRTLLITPFLVMPMAAALIWKHTIYNPTYGLINGLIGGSTDWVSQYPKVAVVATLVWQWTPFMMLILLAGLQGQSQETLEAARVDGANSWQVFVRITLPFLRPYLELGAPARLDLPGQHVRRGLHDHAGRPGRGHDQPAVRDLPDHVPQVRVRRGGRRRRGRGDRHDHRRDVRAAPALQPLQDGGGTMKDRRSVTAIWAVGAWACCHRVLLPGAVDGAHRVQDRRPTRRPTRRPGSSARRSTATARCSAATSRRTCSTR